MAERLSGWHAALSTPVVYELIQHAVGARRWLRRFVRDTVRAQAGERVLDVGCGPAAILRYLPDVDYCGFDHSPSYIEAARGQFGDRARFFCDDVGSIDRHAVGPFDIAIAIGVLHHIDDGQALGLFAKIRDLLAPRGRLITADPCFFDGQPWITRLVVSNDRGVNVRHFDDYLALARKSFPGAVAELEASLLPFPRAACKIVCRKDQS
jgi:SAM-dependent methyltransferase